MWRSDIKQGDEAAKVAAELLEYFEGPCVDLGCGARKVVPARHVVGIDNDQDRGLFGTASHPDLPGDCRDLSFFASGTMATVFSSHLLDRIGDWQAALGEWWRIVRPGGHLILYLADRRHFPAAGMPWRPHDKQHDFAPQDITTAMLGVAFDCGQGWDQVRSEVRAQGDEYSFLQVYRKRTDGACVEYVPPPKPKSSLGIVRLGAFGDALWISAILPELHKHHDHITVYGSAKTAQALGNNPHIDRMVVIPAAIFGLDDDDNRRMGFPTVGEMTSDFIRRMEACHDRLLSLIGTVEGSLLPHRSHPNYWLPESTRRAVVHQNYLETIFRSARVPFDARQVRVQFFPTQAESEWAQAERAKHAGAFVVINPTGSSLPKHWPHAQRAMELLAEEGVRGVVVGDPRGRALEPPPGWQVMGTSVEIRKVFALAMLADVVIGTESAVINAVAHEPPFKIVLLSHSTPYQLTRDWSRTIAAQAEGLSCYPCHRIHPDWQHCTIDAPTGAAACQAAPTADVVVEYALQWIRGELVDADLEVA